jgi:tetratricopeptide (TPR) repeat protein
MKYSIVLSAAVSGVSCLLLGQTSVATSPPELRVQAAEHQVQSNSKSYQAYNDLAFAYWRWARDSGELALYEKAQVALHRSSELEPGNYEGRKLQAAVLLGEGKLTEATQLAVELNKSVPDDINTWALLVDVNVAIGNYPEAERAAQWILDLRPGSSLGFEKAAGLREHFGDSEGASEFYEEALKRTSQGDLDQRAWLLTRDAQQQLALSKRERADELLQQALKLFPTSRLASAVLANTHLAETRASAKTPAVP